MSQLDESKDDLLISKTTSFFQNNLNLQMALKKDFPQTYKLLQYNTVGTLHYLKHRNILSTSNKQYVIGIKHSGDNNLKAWQDYQKGVDEHLKKINSNKLLDKARTIVADKIKSEHYNKFPSWPAPGNTNTAVVDITTYGGYQRKDTDNLEKYIAFCCEGNISVTDKTTEKKTQESLFGSMIKWFLSGEGNTQREYYTEFHGNPALKVAQIILPMLEAFEKQAIEHFDKLKRKVDKKADEIHMKQLEFFKSFELSDSEEE